MCVAYSHSLCSIVQCCLLVHYKLFTSYQEEVATPLNMDFAIQLGNYNVHEPHLGGNAHYSSEQGVSETL